MKKFLNWIKKIWNKIFHKNSKNTNNNNEKNISIYNTDAYAYDCLINIETQEQFNKITENITNAINNGFTNIVIQFSNAVFYFNESHITLSKMNYPNVSIRLVGPCTIIPNCVFYSNEAIPYYYNTFFDNDNNIINMWSDVNESTELITIENSDTKLCKIPNISGIKGTCQEYPYIQVTQWFKSIIYRISKITDKYIYFIASDLAFNNSRNCYNVNLDYAYCGKFPRYRIIKNNSLAVKRGIKTTFLNITNSNFNSFIINGVNFIGNSNEFNTSLIYLYDNTFTSFVIKQCIFDNIISDVIYGVKTLNISINTCYFKRCYNNGINLQGCSYADIDNNYFINMGLSLNNKFCTRAYGENINISNNIFVDYGYGAIGTGCWWKAKMLTKNTGSINNNKIYYTDEYYQNYKQHTLMDSGAIYFLTQNDDIIIENNTIDNYIGMCDNRGIFCDDGAYGFTIRNNKITRTPNSFSIDSRRVLSIETSEGTQVEMVNYNNSIHDNICDGPIRIQGRDKSHPCKFFGNTYVNDGSIIEYVEK